MTKYAALLFLILFCGCKGRHSAKKEHKLSLVTANPIKKRDSVQDAFYKDKYYLPTVIRLNKQDKEAFIRIDSPYFNVKLLDNSNREAYYEKVVATIPKEEMEVYRLVWNVAELRKMQSADGGYGTTMAWIFTRPDKENPYYIVEIRKNNIEEMTPENDISSFKIRLKPLEIQLSDQSGYYVSLEEWEHVNQNK